jgi:broad specificity phosphatase PhoE
MIKFPGLTILLRHFPTQDEVEDKVSAAIDTPSILDIALNELPFLIEQLSSFIERVRIETIYSSDSIQAIQTAKLLSDKLNLKITQSTLLRNIQRPLWEGLTNSEVRVKFKEEFETWTERPGEVHFKNGERVLDVRHRVIDFNKQFVEPKIVITHTTTFHSFLLNNFDLDSNRAWDFKPEMYAFTVLYNGTLWGLNTRSLEYLTLHYR